MQALWQLGFRPFFLLGSLQAIVVMAIWLAFLAGWIPATGFLDPVTWHSHEMVFGFTTAIIAGFLLTATQNWTGIRGVHGPKLIALVALWVAGRFALLAFPEANVVASLLDLAFYPVLAIYLIPYLTKDPDLKTERVFFLFFGLFFAGNLLVHLNALGWLTGHSRRGVLLGVDTVLIVIIFIGGRVIPFFTESSIAKAQPRSRKWVEVASHVSAWLFLIVQLFAEISLAAAAVAFATAAIHLARLAGWYVRRVRRIPLIWILHLGYLWLVVGFALSGLAALGLAPPGVAIHAFTVGCIGVIIFGMISRVSLGHTGRRLHPSKGIVVGYYLLLGSAFFRVFGPLLGEDFIGWMLRISGLLWIAAFAVFVVIYSPILTAPRIDRRPG